MDRVRIGDVYEVRPDVGSVRAVALNPSRWEVVGMTGDVVTLECGKFRMPVGLAALAREFIRIQRGPIVVTKGF